MSKKTKLREQDGQIWLTFHPHGYEYPLELPVITKGKREGTASWTWNGNREKPTIHPSVKTTHGGGGFISHFWLNDGFCRHLSDSTDGFAGQTLPLQDLE